MDRFNTEIMFSGPAPARDSERSAAIRNAPAYDTETAKSLIPVMPEIRKMADGILADDLLTAFGPVKPGSAALEALEREIRILMAGGHKVSVIMADLRKRSGISFCSSVPMCSQSTVKAIYTGALLDSFPEALSENGRYIHDAVVYSDNAAYEKLRRIYGRASLEKWCGESGVSPTFARHDYPRDKTAKDMFKMWTRLYCFLNGKGLFTDYAAWLSDSIASAAAAKLGSRFPVQTKAGWENGLDESGCYDPNAEIPARFIDGDPLNDECAVNDSGIVYTDRGPYIFVIYTDHPFGIFKDYVPPNPLYGLTESLYEVQRTLAED